MVIQVKWWLGTLVVCYFFWFGNHSLGSLYECIVW